MAAFQCPWHAGHTSRYQPRLEEEAGWAPGRAGGLWDGESRCWLPAQLPQPRMLRSGRRHAWSTRSSQGLKPSPSFHRASTRRPLPSQGQGAQGSSSARPGPAALRLGLQIKSPPPRAKDGSTPRTCLERSRKRLLLLNQPLCLLFQTKKASHSYFTQAAHAFKSLQTSTHSGDLSACQWPLSFPGETC